MRTLHEIETDAEGRLVDGTLRYPVLDALIREAYAAGILAADQAADEMEAYGSTAMRQAIASELASALSRVDAA